MIFCRVVMGIKWECLCKMPTTYWPTNMSFLCACMCFPSASLHFHSGFVCKFKKIIIKHKKRNSHGRRLSPATVLVTHHEDPGSPCPPSAFISSSVTLGLPSLEGMGCYPSGSLFHGEDPPGWAGGWGVRQGPGERVMREGQLCNHRALTCGGSRPDSS